MTTAEFEIEASPYADRGYDATEDQVVSLALADPSLDVYTVRYSIVGKTKYAPASFTFSPSTGIAATPSTPVTLDVGSPTEVGRPHSLRVRCQINNGRNPDGTINTEFTKDRIIAVRNPVGLRSVVVGETLDYDPEFGWFGWAEEIADVAGGSFTLSNATPTEVGDSGDATPGGGTNATREGHRHEHGNRGGGTLHLAATSLLAGFMSAADKTAHDANTTAIGAATSAATANTIAKRGASGECAFVRVNTDIVRGSTGLQLQPNGASFVTLSGGATDTWEFNDGAPTLLFNSANSVTVNGDSLNLGATGADVSVNAAGDILLSPTGQCQVNGTLAISTLIVNSEGVSIGPSAAAPGATQNGAIQLHTAAPTGNPADVNKAWIWLDGGNGIDTRDTSGNRIFVNVQSVICDVGVLAAVTVVTPQVSYNVDVGLDVEFVHGSGGKFDYKRGATSYAQRTFDGTEVTDETFSTYPWVVKSGDKITLFAAASLAQYQAGREWWTMASSSPDWAWTIDPDTGGIANIDSTKALALSCSTGFSVAVSGTGAPITKNFSSTGWISEEKTYSATITNPATTAVISLDDVTASQAYGYTIEVLARVTAGSTAYSRVLRTTLHTAIRRGSSGNASIETTTETGPNRSNASYSATIALSTNTPQVTVTIASGDSAAVLVRVERTTM